MEVTAGERKTRDITIFFKASCEQPSYYSSGKYLRSMLAKSLQRIGGRELDLVVQCLNTTMGSPDYNEQPHDQLMSTLFRSIFCPVVSGDSQTSQHLTERYIAGCIPVFVGPPYHTMAFEKEVNYASSAIFLNVTESRAWLKEEMMEWEFPMIPLLGWDHKMMGLDAFRRGAESPKWWFPWIDKRHLISIQTLDDIIPVLRAKPREEIQALQREVNRQRSKFLYIWGNPGRPGALDIIIDNVCHFVGKKCDPVQYSFPNVL